MDAKTLMTLGFTFLVGCFSGAYLYVTVFAPQYVSDGFEDPSEITFKLQGQAYGGCFRGGSCPMIELESNRSYVYLQPASSLVEELRVAGKMSREDFSELVDLLSETNFSRLSQESNRSCDSYVDGIDYRYNVTIDGESFELDTCGTTFYNSNLERTLRALWSDFKEPNDTVSWWPEGGLKAAAYDTIDNWFQYDEKRNALKE